MLQKPTLGLFSKIARAIVRQPAPAFAGMAWKDRFFPLSLEDYKGKYLVLFFYPLDFSFVCPTELVEFSKMHSEFVDSGCEIVGCSTQHHFSKRIWTK